MESNYNVHVGDLANTLLFKKGYCKETTPKVLESLLFLMGLDTTQDYEEASLAEGEGYRLKDNSVVYGGFIFRGMSRTDWSEAMTDKYLNTEDGVRQIVEVLKLSKSQ